MVLHLVIRLSAAVRHIGEGQDTLPVRGEVVSVAVVAVRLSDVVR